MRKKLIPYVRRHAQRIRCTPDMRTSFGRTAPLTFMGTEADVAQAERDARSAEMHSLEVSAGWWDI